MLVAFRSGGEFLGPTAVSWLDRRESLFLRGTHWRTQRQKTRPLPVTLKWFRINSPNQTQGENEWGKRSAMDKPDQQTVLLQPPPNLKFLQL